MSDLERRVAALEEQSVKMIPKAALDIFADDQHRFSTRGCATCRNISLLIGEPWGCMALAEKRRQSR